MNALPLFILNKMNQLTIFLKINQIFKHQIIKRKRVTGKLMMTIIKKMMNNNKQTEWMSIQVMVANKILLPLMIRIRYKKIKIITMMIRIMKQIEILKINLKIQILRKRLLCHITVHLFQNQLLLYNNSIVMMFQLRLLAKLL